MAQRKDRVPMGYMTAKSVMAEFGGICDMTLSRWLADDRLDFPRPIYIKRRRYFSHDEIEAFKQRSASRYADNRFGKSNG